MIKIEKLNQELLPTIMLFTDLTRLVNDYHSHAEYFSGN